MAAHEATHLLSPSGPAPPPAAGGSPPGALDGGGGATSPTAHGGGQQMQLQPVFIPRQHPGVGGMAPFRQQQQQATSPLVGAASLAGTGGGGSGSVDWAFLLRSAGMLPRDGSTSDAQQYHQQYQQQQHYQHLLAAAGSSSSSCNAVAPTPQHDRAGAPRGAPPSPRGSQLLGSGRGGGSLHMFSTSSSSSGLSLVPHTTSGMMALEALGGASFSADALAGGGGGGHPSNSSFGALLSASNSLAPSSVLSGMMYGGDGVQTLYASDDSAAAAAAAAAMSATERAHHSAAQSILQQQQQHAAALSGLNLASSLSLSGLGKYEESLSGSLFGTGPVPPALLSPKPMSASLYIKNLPIDADKLMLYEKFSPYGAILSVKVLSDPQTGQCRGVGFVNYAESDSALRSIQALHGTKIGDKLLHVSLQMPRLRAAALHTPQ